VATSEVVDELFERFRGEMLDCLLFTNVTTTINAGDRQLTRRYSATLRMSDLDRAVRQQSLRPPLLHHHTSALSYYISPACGTHSSKPAARCCSGL